ncbi:hypothetical protein J3R82DRAFT_2998 [Butyriboletus roseoflavus]|nr:hypothetical protein J3R82DRAFT_2998 [Butyriboletus roseoflavus]
MSTTTTIDMARSSFSTAAFAQLAHRLRHTNARYNQIAHQFHCHIRPTHHAKRRACRAGLCIDTSKARACPQKTVSIHQPPVLDRSAGPGWVNTPATVYATAEPETGSEGHAYMRDLALRNLPEVIVREPRTHDGRKRVMLRLPPLKLQLNGNYPSGASVSQFQGPVPGAPRLLPRQLPHVECGMDESMPGSMSSPMHGSHSLLTHLAQYSDLCVTVPPRNVKRKLQDVEADGDAAMSQQPKVGVPLNNTLP